MNEVVLSREISRFADNDAGDVRRLKAGLNRLGVYHPDPSVGMNEEADERLWEALAGYQRAHGLPVLPVIGPDLDVTLGQINADLARAEMQGGRYIWRTVGDDKVRADHAALEGDVRRWDDDPDPTQEYNCRCWAEPVITDAIRPVYPELLFIPAVKILRIFRLIKTILSSYKKKGYTSHGSERSAQRKASQEDIQEAIRSAKRSGNVKVKTGKYGTPQNHYRGSNGLTVIEETEGRNAGKIITLWWHN